MNEWGFVWEIKTFEQGRIIFLYAWATEANEFVWKKKGIKKKKKRRQAAKILIVLDHRPPQKKKGKKNRS